ncbi:MAG TPA: cytochrome c biogenesis protein CcdA [Bacilli bacterium]
MELNIWIALLGGFASFISPCCLPLYPSYISYITGISVSQLKSAQTTKEIRLRTMSHTFFFILGFSIVFYTLGFGAGVLGDAFKTNAELIRKIAALLIIAMGLFLLGVFNPMWLLKERKLQWKTRPIGYMGTVLIGIGFAAGWSPCVGPILTAILSLALSEPGAWFILITAYVFGFAIPFFVLAFFIGSAKWILRYSTVLMKIGGGLMIVMGILLFTDQMTAITNWLNAITPDWLKF